MKKIIISLFLAAFVAAPVEVCAQNTQNQSRSLFDRMRQHKLENKDKKTTDKKATTPAKNTVKKNMTNRERANILYPLLNNMVKMKSGTIYHAGNKTTVNECRINRRAVTNREYAAATDIWLNTSAPDAPAVVNNSQRQLFIKCMMQAIGHGAPSGDIVRLASQDEVNYGKNNSYLSTSNSSHIYFVYRGYWEKDIQRKSGLALFGEKIN
ncbi:MAG: hypothetical protein J5942_05585 [Prevotella sp.]|nr:hypothetical protein [Prevotella sp.]